MYRDANGNPVKDNTFYRVKRGTPNQVIFVGNLQQNERQLPKDRRLQPNAFKSYIPIKNPQEYAENLKSQAYDLNRAERLIKNNLETKSRSPNITFEFGWD